MERILRYHLLHIAFYLAIFQTMVLSKRMNVLFLVSDDMRPEINIYNGPDFPTPRHPKMHTPNLDALAKKSLLLKRAFVQQAVCSPSRTSLLTGRRPDTTRVQDLTKYWRKVAGNFTTIPQYFKEHGYLSLGMGKIFHPGSASGNDDPISWSEPNWQPDDSHWNSSTPISWYAADEAETSEFPLMDMQTAQYAIETITKLAPKVLSENLNFFLAVGFHKPHLPFIFPANFLQYYPWEDVHLPLNPYTTTDLPEVAWSTFDELRWYSDIGAKYGHGYMNTTLPDTLVRQLRRAYYSALTYTDSLLGKVIDTLNNLGLADDTIIAFWGDHGWQLGEHGEWCKHTNYEIATHAPMMIHIPGQTDRGIVIEQLTEFVDLFPTLVEAAGLPAIPLCPKNSRYLATCSEGISMMPLVREPKRQWKSGVFSQYPRMLMDGDVVMGYRLRTHSYSYVEWVHYDTINYRPIFDEIYGHFVELYDLNEDPNENINRAFCPKYKHVREILSKELRDGWRKALPVGVSSM